MAHARDRQNELLLKLSSLPQRMVAMHTQHNLAEFILHELFHPLESEFRHIAFFIDNPDFNCMKGVAGISHAHPFSCECVWTNSDAFTEHMRGAEFNNKVRSITRNSVSHHDAEAQKQLLHDLGASIGIENPGYHRFGAKHGNTGILLYNPQDASEASRDHLMVGSSYLAWCPIF